MSEIFNKIWMTEADQLAARISELWPLILGFHFNTDMKLQCSGFTKGPRPSASMSVVSGINVLKISVTADNNYEVRIFCSTLSNGTLSSGKPIMASKNSTYLINQLKKKDTKAVKAIALAIKMAEANISNEVKGIPMSMGNSIGDSTNTDAPKPLGFASEPTECLLDVVFGGASLLHVPQKMLDILNAKHIEFKNYAEKKAKATNMITEMLGCPKYVVGVSHNQHYAVCVISPELLLANVLHYAEHKKSWGLPHTQPVAFDIPPMLYPSLDAIPNPIHDDLMARLTMIKIHWGNKPFAAGGMIPDASKGSMRGHAIEEAGAFIWNNCNNENFIMLDAG